MIKQIELSDPQADIVESTSQRNLFHSGVGCFSGETLVHTIDGFKEIANVVKGDRVLSFNLLNEKPEFKIVVDKFEYKKGYIKQNIIIFTLINGTVIKCTENHEFYEKGIWIRASDIAKRIVENNSKYRWKISNKLVRKISFDELEPERVYKNNETGTRCWRLFKNLNNDCGKVYYGKIASGCSSKLYPKSGIKERGESFGWFKNKQLSGKPPMVDKVGKPKTRLRCWIGFQCWGKAPKFKINRNGSNGNEDTTKCSYTQSYFIGVVRKIFCFNRNNKRYNLQAESGLVAREITGIDSFQIVSLNESVYDLCVEDNHNYCITKDSIIVHNSGKSHCIGLIAADFILNNPEVRGFIGANTYSQLSKSTLDRIFKVWEGTLNIKRGPHYVSNIQPPKNFKVIGPRLTSYEHTISFSNGGLIFTASLDNYKVIDGTEFGWACLDETKDTKEEAVREVITARLRQQGMYLSPAGTICKEKKTDEYKGFNPLYIFTSPAKTDWLAEWFDIPEHFEEINATIFSETDYFRKKSGDKLVVISSTYHNKTNLSEGYIERLIDDNKHNSQRINMLIYGSPLAKTGGEYFSRFDRLVHLKYIPINPNLPIHLSFDFNRNPYMTATCFQTWWDDVKQKWIVNKFDEFCLETPKNYTEALCLDIEFKYSHLLKNGLFFYGDYSGKAGRTNSTEDDYDVINRILKPYIGSYSDRVITNKGLSARHDFMNKILFGGLPIEYFQAPSCKNSINEYEYLKEDPNGGKLKQLATNPNTGVQYQKYGHIADCDEYFFTSAYAQFYNI